MYNATNYKAVDANQVKRMPHTVTSHAKAKLDCVSVQQRLNATVFNAISKRQISISKSRKTKQDKAKFDCASVQQRLNATPFNAISKKQIWISKTRAPVHPHISSFCTSINVPLLPSQGSVYVSLPTLTIENNRKSFTTNESFLRFLSAKNVHYKIIFVYKSL